RDTVFFKIYDGDRLIRTLKYKTPEKKGFHRVYWNLDEAGPDRPSRRIRKRTREPGGATVKPGNYKVVVEYGDLTDETSVTVKTDPRINVSLSAINAVYETTKKLEGHMQTAADAVKQLVESKNIANKFQRELKVLDKEKFKDQIKTSGDMVKAIDSVIAVYLGKEDKRQGITRNPEITVMRRIGNAYRYVASRKTGITSTEEQLIKFAQDDLKAALQQTNAFFANRWKAYKEEMEKLELSPFKETETFTLE
ncbi:MAG: hypothetical protein KJN96_01370, partial [Eudoraea sp.]|nr:hypothetical protein [Eudoraea sp.]